MPVLNTAVTQKKWRIIRRFTGSRTPEALLRALIRAHRV